VKCTTQIENSKGVLKLEGRFTFEAGADFKAQSHSLLEQAAVTELQVDFGGITFMESSALGILLLLREKAEAKGARVALLNTSPAVRSILDAVQFGKLFEIR